MPNRRCRALTYPDGQSTWIEVGGVSSSEETTGRATSSTYTCASGLSHEFAVVVQSVSPAPLQLIMPDKLQARLTGQHPATLDPSTTNGIAMLHKQRDSKVPSFVDTQVRFPVLVYSSGNISRAQTRLGDACLGPMGRV